MADGVAGVRAGGGGAARAAARVVDRAAAVRVATLAVCPAEVTVGEALEAGVRGLVGALVAVGGGEGVSPAVEPAVAMAEEAMAVA